MEFFLCFCLFFFLSVLSFILLNVIIHPPPQSEIHVEKPWKVATDTKKVVIEVMPAVILHSYAIYSHL